MDQRPISLYDDDGRKDLTPGKLQAFLYDARHASPDVHTFSETLAHTGCLLSEALALTTGHATEPVLRSSPFMRWITAICFLVKLHIDPS